MDYAKGKIYKLLNNIDDDVYVGSTCQSLSRRMAKHRWCTKSTVSCDRPLYAKMNELGVDQFYIELLEEYPCDNKEQLNAREGYYIRSTGTLNMTIAGRSKHQYNIDNKDTIKEKKYIYGVKNKDEIHAKKKQYYETHKDEICERSKLYQQTHKDEIAVKTKQYRETNKEIINKRFECSVCDGSYLPRHKKTHEQTQKHQQALTGCENC